MKQARYKINKWDPCGFRFAFNGIRSFFREEPNARVHFVATILLVAAIFYFPVTRGEIVALVIAAASVWVAELFNTAIEKIMDIVSPAHHPLVGFIKDVSSAAVLITAVAAVIIGAIIFIPKII